MKKIVLTAIAVCGFGFANAQDADAGAGFSKGNVMIQGGFGISSGSQADNKQNNFFVAPRVGYFLSKNFVAGVQLEYSSTKNEQGSSVPINKSNSFGVGAFGRYYATPSNKFSFFGEASFSVFNSESERIFTNSIFNTSNKSGGFNIAVAPGVSYFISKNFALETSIGILGYRTEEAKDVPGSEPFNTFNFGFDTTRINFGLVYKF